MSTFSPIHFIDKEVEVHFNKPPQRQKTPPCPDSFTWNGYQYRISEKISEWTDFTRKDRMARNMQLAHVVVAAKRGSLGVGRFFFRVLVDTKQYFDLYYDREIKNVDDRLGHWYLYRELERQGKI
jgi:hypothetical protein